MASLALVFDILAKDKASKEFAKVGDAAEGAGKKSSNLGPLLAKGMAALGAAGVAAGVGAFKLGQSFDKAYDEIRVGTGATGDALKGLEGDFKSVVKSVPTDFGSASKAIADLNTRTGLIGKPLQDMAKQVLEVTRLTGGDLSTNIASVTRVFGDWGVKTDDQSKTLDFLFKTSQSTGIGLDKLSEKVVQFGAPMRQFGFSFEESAVLMGKWEKEGVNTETIMGGLRAGLGKLAKSGKEPAQAFKDVTAAIKNAGSEGEATAIAIETFGQRAGPDLAAAVREGRFDIDELVKSLNDSPESILGAAAATEDFSEKMTKLKNRVLVGLEPLAIRVFDAIGKGLDRAVPLMQSFVAGLRGDGPIKGFTGTLNTLGLGLRALVEAFKFGDVTSDGFVGKMELVGDTLFRLRPKIAEAAKEARERLVPIVAQIARIAINDVVPALITVIQWTAALVKGFVNVVQNTPTPILKAVAAAVVALVAVLGTAVAINKTAAAATAAYSAVKLIFISTTNAETGAVTLSTIARGRATVATAAGTVATVASTAAHAAARVVMIAFTAAKTVGTVATVAMTAATTALGVAVRFALGPIGLAITAIGLLTAGVVAAYKNSDTFRAIVDRVWQALKTAGTWITDTGRKVETWITDKFKAAKDKAQEFVDVVKGFVLPGWVKDMAGLLGSIGGGFKSAFSAIKGGVGDGPGIGGEGGQPRGVQAMMRALPPGTKLISGVRPGARTATGKQSYHALGRAVDLPPNRALFEYIRANFGASSKELIFSPAGGRQLNNGKQHLYTGITRQMHFDHIHWAMDRGGVAKGIGFMPKLTRRPERVLSPRQTESFERLVTMLGRQRNRGIRAEDGSYVRRGFYDSAPARPVSTAQYVDNSALLLELQRLRSDIRSLPRSYQLGMRAGVVAR